MAGIRMTSALTETQVANRALQRVGAQRIADGLLWSEDSSQASELRACYHMIRRYEQARNVWTFSCRRVVIRPIDTNSKFVTFGTYAGGTTYALNDVVLGSDGLIYQSAAASNIGHDPTTPNYTYWDRYYGAVVAEEFVTTWSSAITYALGDHSVGSDGSVYTSLVDANLNHNPVGDNDVHWSLATTIDADDDTEATDTTFYSGELVYIGGNVYLSLQNDNGNSPVGSSKWMTFTTAATVANPNIIYPVGAGPFSDATTRNLYRLPNGYLRRAPQAPKAGSTLFLGAPGGLSYNDWEFQEDYLITMDAGPIPFRFSADIANPALFHPMYAEGLSCTLALNVCERLTQSTAKMQMIGAQYQKFMGEARNVNGIEQGAEEPPEDSYITCRV